MRKGQDAILITGATGNQGGALANELLRAGHAVIAMTRNPSGEKAQSLANRGAKVVTGDLNDEGSLRRALKGAWGALAVQNTWEAGVEGEEEQGHRFARIAKESGIQHLVYASVGSAHRRTGIPHFDNKYRIEDTIRGLGFPSYTIIRAVFFMENFLGPWFKPGIDQGSLYMGIKPTTRLQMIAVRDIGKYLARAFEQHEKLKNKELDIAGDELTMPEVARILTEATGHTVTHVQVPIEEVRKNSADFAAMLEWFDKVGYDVDIEANTKNYGITPTRFGEWAKSVKWS